VTEKRPEHLWELERLRLEPMLQLTMDERVDHPRHWVAWRSDLRCPGFLVQQPRMPVVAMQLVCFVVLALRCCSYSRQLVGEGVEPRSSSRSWQVPWGLRTRCVDQQRSDELAHERKEVVVGDADEEALVDHLDLRDSLREGPCCYCLEETSPLDRAEVG